MIHSQEGRDEIAAEWRAVEEMVELARWSWTEIDTGYGPFEFTRELTVTALNLCVVMGFGVLEKTLLLLRSEGQFATTDCSCFGLMRASQEAGLVWHDFSRINSIRRQRNEIAHRNSRFAENECLVMLLAVAEELEQHAGVSPRRRFFMHSVGLSALNQNGHRFHFDISFPADLAEELRHEIHRVAEGVARRTNATSEFNKKLGEALSEHGLPHGRLLLTNFRFEGDENESAEPDAAPDTGRM